MNPITTVVSGLIKPASDAFAAHTARKQARETSRAKVAQAKADNSHELSMTQLELEMVSKQLEGGTWRDEYVTIIGTLPFILIFAAAIAEAFGVGEVMEGVNIALGTLREMEVPVGDIILWTILAGLGLRGLKRP